MATDQRPTSRQDLIDRLQQVAAKLERRTVSRSEFQRETGISEWQISKHFESWNDLVESAGLEPYVANLRADDGTLFEAMRDAFVEGGAVLTRARFRKVCRFSDWVYTKRWGRWQNVLVQFRAWAEQHDPDFPFLNDLPAGGPSRAVAAVAKPAAQHAAWRPTQPTHYGPFLNFRGLQHAPINEQGVVFLFGMVAFDLGYVVEGVGVGFPDCEAKRCVDKSGDVWERVRIEFEYKSRNFLDHGHRADDCDVLVCWEHNWLECPVEVLELRSAIDTLGE